MRKPIVARCARTCSFVVLITLSMLGLAARAQASANADALLAIDQQRASVVERIVDLWGPALAKSSDYVSVNDLRQRLLSLRADALLAASLAGTEEGLREVTELRPVASKTSATQTKALGDTTNDVVYTPVTPCRLVETRGTFAAVYQGNGTPAHTADPFTANQIRSYAIQGGNGVCLTQLPAGLNPAAVQLQVFGLPTTSASGDIEILPQGSTFGSTATMVYVGAIAFNTVSTAAKINPANNEISVQVRGGGANLAMDVVGYFAAPSGNGGKFFQQGGNAFGTTATLGTVDNQPLTVLVNNQPTLRMTAVTEGLSNGVNVVNGHSSNNVSAGVYGATISGGGSDAGAATEPNSVTGALGTIGGGLSNVAFEEATVSGGGNNSAAGVQATIGGGGFNTASDMAATVAGGNSNTASGMGATVAGGNSNTASGQEATVTGGELNIASGNGSLAAGSFASADQNNCAVFGLWGTLTPMTCLSSPSIFRIGDLHGFSVDYFSQRPDGGGTRWLAVGDLFVGQTIATWTGAFLSDAGVWVNGSSAKSRKTDFDYVDVNAVLEHVVALPITTWRYKQGEGSIRHMGPMAEDFWDAFHIGYGDQTIADLDARGVELAAIQGLHQLVQEKDARIDALERELRSQRDVQRATATEMATLRQKVEALIAHLR